jgi:hypothetical protein
MLNYYVFIIEFAATYRHNGNTHDQARQAGRGFFDSYPLLPSVNQAEFYFYKGSEKVFAIRLDYNRE